MAERKASLILELKDRATATLDSVISKVTGMSVGALSLAGGIAAAGAAVVAFGVDAFKSFQASEVAVNKLTTALRNQDLLTDQYKDSLLAQSSALQQVTGFSDEVIVETMALITTFGLAGDKLNGTTKAALDLSIGLGIDLRTATMLLGKALAGETGTLARYGIKIDETLKGAKAFDSVLAQVNGRFGGAAAAELNTYAGKIKNLGNEWDDVKEQIGELLLGPALAVIKWMQDAVVVADFLAKKIDKLFNPKFDAARRLNEIKGILTQMGTDDKGHIAINIRNKLLEEQARLIKHLADAQVAAEGAVPAVSKRVTKPTEDDEELKAKQKNADMLLEMDFKLGEQLDANKRDRIDYQIFLDKRAQEQEASTQKARVASTITMLNMLSSLSNAKNKEIAVIGKAAAFSLAMINAHVAASNALAAFSKIPPLAFSMAAIMYAAGAAQAAQIAGVPLAHGGMLMPQSGGVPVIMAEAGKREVAIPLDDDRTKEALRDTFSGGQSASITIQAGVIVADKMAVKEFAQQIDEALFSLRRNRKSAALD